MSFLQLFSQFDHSFCDISQAHSQDREYTNASEFSILVSGIDPKMATHNFAETIKDFFTSKVSVLKLERNLEVTNIDLVFNIGMQKTLQK